MKKPLIFFFLGVATILCLAALPTTLNTTQFNTTGPLSIKTTPQATNILAGKSSGLLNLSFVGDTDTGISNTTDEIHFWVGNNGVWQFSSSGHLYPLITGLDLGNTTIPVRTGNFGGSGGSVQFVGASTATVSGAGQAKLYFDTDDNNLYLSENGAAYVAITSGGIDGSGTANFIPKFSDSDTLANSSFFDNGTITSNALPFLMPDGTASAPVFSLTSEPTTGFYKVGTANIGLSLQSTRRHSFAASTYSLEHDSATLQLGTSLDVKIVRDAANTLALRNGAADQTLNIYGLFTDTSNRHYANHAMSDTAYTISVLTAGTGVDDLNLNLAAAGTGTINLNSTVGTLTTRNDAFDTFLSSSTLSLSGDGSSAVTLSGPAGGNSIFVEDGKGLDFGSGTINIAAAAASSAAITVNGTPLIISGAEVQIVDQLEVGAGGVDPNGGGFKHKRVTTGSVNAASTALVTVTWGTAFADTNYTATASVFETTTSSLSISVVHIESVTAAAITVRVINNAAGALTGEVHAFAVHD